MTPISVTVTDDRWKTARTDKGSRADILMTIANSEKANGNGDGDCEMLHENHDSIFEKNMEDNWQHLVYFMEWCLDGFHCH